MPVSVYAITRARLRTISSWFMTNHHPHLFSYTAASVFSNKLTYFYKAPTIDPGAVQLPPNIGLDLSQMWHETLFDELEASAYRCKNGRSQSVAFKIRQNAFPFQPGSRWGAQDAPPDPLVGLGRDTPPITTQLGASIIPPSASRFGARGNTPKISFL